MSYEDGRDGNAIAGQPLDAAVAQVLDRNEVAPSAAGSPAPAKTNHSFSNEKYVSNDGKSVSPAHGSSSDASASDEADTPDPESVRATLDLVARDGVVSRDAAEEALGEASKVVSTAETRTELAARELSNAREEAEPISHLDAVAARLDGFEARLASVEDREAELGSELDSLVGSIDESGALYEVALGIRRLTAAANEVQRTADELAQDLESFERWVASPAVRFDELDSDADAVERSIDELAAATDEIASAAEGVAADESTASADGSAIDAEAAWADARLRVRVTDLLVDDLQAELADLRAWDDGESAEAERADRLADRLGDVDARLAGIDDRLDDLARPAWEERFGDRLAAFETATDDLEPPFDWGAVQAAFDKHRPEVEGSE